jgi:predicted transposase YbfD/YdcC
MLVSCLFKIKDHRRKQGRQYRLGHILLFSILAIMSGADSYRKVHAFIEEHQVTLNRIFGLSWKRTPAHTTIRYIIRGVSSHEIEQSFREYSAELAANTGGKRLVSLDGKVLRGSFDHFKDQKAIQILSAFLTDCDIILAHEEIADKTNEIPTAQELIRKLGLSGCVFTFDAINCQEKTLAAAKETGNDVIVQVKENQKTLYQDCLTTADLQLPSDVYQEPVTKAHHRIESRRVEVFTHMIITDRNKWQLVEAMVKVQRSKLAFDTKAKCWQQSHETSFYIATTVLSAQTFCQGIRNHWGIENQDHYVRDVSLSEDHSRIRVNPHIFAKLRSFALNILRANRVSNIHLELFKNCMNLNRVLNYTGIWEN